MTPTTSAVRAACDAASPNANSPCWWPTCAGRCPPGKLPEAFVSTLLANARAEGAAGEREHLMDIGGVKPGPITMPREAYPMVYIKPDRRYFWCIIEYNDERRIGMGLYNLRILHDRIGAALETIRDRDAKEASGD